MEERIREIISSIGYHIIDFNNDEEVENISRDNINVQLIGRNFNSLSALNDNFDHRANIMIRFSDNEIDIVSRINLNNLNEEILISPLVENFRSEFGNSGEHFILSVIKLWRN